MLLTRREDEFGKTSAPVVTHSPVTTRIAAPGLGARVEVIFEDRALAPRDGRLQDVFAPLAVHVYKW